MARIAPLLRVPTQLQRPPGQLQRPPPVYNSISIGIEELLKASINWIHTFDRANTLCYI